MHNDAFSAQSDQTESQDWRGDGPEPDDDGGYLEQELTDLATADGRIFDFLHTGALDGIWFWDLENPELEWMDDRFWEVLGYDPEDMPHRAEAWQNIIFEDDLKLALDNFHKHLADPDHPYDQVVRYRHHDGSTVTLRCRGLAIRDETGKPIRMLGAHTDLTELIRGQEELRSASAMKSAFIANLSHELRTPLNVILGAAELLGASVGSARDRKLLDSISAAGRQAAALLDDATDVSRIEMGDIGLELDAFEPGQVLDEVGAMFAPSAQERNVALAVTHGASMNDTVIGGMRHFRQIAINLITNALKHADASRIIVIARIEDAPEGHGADERTLALEVIDDGQGVPDELKRDVFDRYIQGDAAAAVEAARKEGRLPGAGIFSLSGGVGLGLSISRMLCAAHEGSLLLTDTPGGGATFIARMLVRVEEEAATIPAAQRVAATAGVVFPDLPDFRILIADDNAVNLALLRRAVETTGAEIVLAHDGLEVLAALRAQDFDVALLDVKMPGMTGADAVRTFLHELDDSPRARPLFVACTAHGQPEQRSAYAQIGFDFHLPKPFRLAELSGLLSAVAEAKAAGETNAAAPKGAGAGDGAGAGNRAGAGNGAAGEAHRDA